MRELIQEKISQCARIPQRHQMNLCIIEQKEQVQLVHDKDTGEYLNYRQLLQDPKHKDVWERSAANELEDSAKASVMEE